MNIWDKHLKRADVVITDEMQRARALVLPLFSGSTHHQQDDAYRVMRALEPATPEPLVVFINGTRHEFPGSMRHEIMGLFAHLVDKYPEKFSFEGPKISKTTQDFKDALDNQIKAAYGDVGRFGPVMPTPAPPFTGPRVHTRSYDGNYGIAHTHRRFTDK